MLTILLVEDSAEDAVRVRGVLAKAPQPGFSVVGVSGINEAVARLAAGGIDAILLDLELLRSNGVAALGGISRAAPDTPIVVLTSSDDSSLMAELLDLGVHNYLVKSELGPCTLAGMLVCSVARKKVLSELQARCDGLSEFLSAIRAGQIDAIVGSDAGSTVFHVESMKLYDDNVRLTRELSDSNARLKRTDEIKSEFLSTASHELRTPLTIIREYMAIIRDGIAGPVTSEQTECLNAGLKSCDRLGNLLDDILDLQRIESGRQKLRRRRTDLVTVLRDRVRDFMPKCESKRQKLALQAADDLPPVLCDHEKITQVVVNLLGNAHKFTPEGGRLTLKASVEDPEGRFVAIAVEDTGCGLSREDQKRVFDRFTQIDRVPGAGAKGTGLGLAIVKAIVGQHGGQISLDSVPGKGSTFSFTVPVYTETGEVASFVEDCLRLVTPSGKKLAVILVRMVDAFPEVCGNEKGNERLYLEEIERHIRSILRRKDDATLIVDSGHMVIVAAEADAEGAIALRRRIEETIADALGSSSPVAMAHSVLGAGDSIDDWIASTKGAFMKLGPIEIPQHVLIIGDDDTTLSCASNALEASTLNVKVTAVNDGFHGWMRCGTLNPSLVILSVNAPGFDGEVVLRHIKGDVQWGDTKVMIISETPERFPRLKKLGADICLLKPLRLIELIEGTAKLLGANRKPGTRQPAPATAPRPA